MPIRDIKLPRDLEIMVDLIDRSFRYPDHPEWEPDREDMDQIRESTVTLKKIWPLIRIAGLFSAQLRDVLLGYVWEEDGQPVAITNIARRGNSDQWEIGNVSVLPEYRRRGLARRLVVACIDLVKERKGTQAVLDVIDRNIPAYGLYTSLGFEHFSGLHDMEWENPSLNSPAEIPAGYTLEHCKDINWRPRYELAKRITPEAEQKYKPVTESVYRVSPALIPIIRLVELAMREETNGYLIRDKSGLVVGTVRYSARKKTGSKHNVTVRLDPAHEAIARDMILWASEKALAVSEPVAISTTLLRWQTGTIEAAEALGFKTMRVMHTLGMDM